MLILQVGLKSCVWPRRKRWYRSFLRTRLQLARRGQNVVKNRTTLCVERQAGGLKISMLRDGRPWARASSNTSLFYCGRTSFNMSLLSLRPSPNSQISARPRKRSTILGDVLSSPGHQEPSSEKNDLYHRFCLGKIPMDPFKPQKILQGKTTVL